MKLPIGFLLSGFTFLALAGCSKDDTTAAPATGPKEYEVEYRISSTTGQDTDFVLYYNETGGQTQLATVRLPVTYKFKRTMKQGDITSVSASLSGATATSDITTTILLNGKVNDTKTARGQGLATAVYIIGQ